MTRYVRRAALAAAILAVPLTTAAMFAVGSGATASAAPLATPVSQSVATGVTVYGAADDEATDDLVYAPAVAAADGTVQFVDVKKKKKKKKKTTTTKTTPATKPTTTKPESSSLAAFETEVIRLTNVQRAASGCAALKTDARLTNAARAHSADMVTKNFFSHTGSNGSDFVAREKAAGYPSPSAENIAWGQRTPAAVMDAWMNSSGHRANILNCGSVAVGVGVELKADGTPYWTQDFGR